MKKYLILSFFVFGFLWIAFQKVNSQANKESSTGKCVRITTWNIANFGRSKHDSIIQYAAAIINSTDLLCIQEVSVSPGGAQAVARLADALQRKGSDWDYRISDPTSGEGSERYAVLWKKHRVRMFGKLWLEPTLADSIHREPALARFVSENDTFLIATIHSVPKSKDPDRENKFLYTLDKLYEKDHLLIMGDFNASHERKAFDELYKRKIDPSIIRQKTTLKMKPDLNSGEHLANAYDNIFYEKDEIQLFDSGIIDFSFHYKDLQAARKLSDHLPVWGCYSVR